LPSNAGVNIRRKGFAHERELAVRLYREGFAVIRAPASGSLSILSFRFCISQLPS